jgi:hypothetical protein
VFFNILLTALNEVQRQYPFYIKQMGSTLILQLPACYADDLHLISACQEATIKCNYLISAFAVMFGIKFASKKLRAITTAAEPGVVILYDREWIPIVKPFGDKEELLKSLGISSSTGIFNLRPWRPRLQKWPQSWFVGRPQRWPGPWRKGLSLSRKSCTRYNSIHFCVLSWTS